jgi:hypothetical protein
MRVINCTRASLAALAAAAAVLLSVRADAQTAATRTSNFSIYVRTVPIGTEQVHTERTADGWSISSTGRIGAPIDLIIRQFRARYDAEWKPLELTIDGSVRGQVSMMHTKVAGTTATTEIGGAPGIPPGERTDPIDAQALFLPAPFIATYEALSANQDSRHWSARAQRNGFRRSIA